MLKWVVISQPNVWSGGRDQLINKVGMRRCWVTLVCNGCFHVILPVIPIQTCPVVAVCLLMLKFMWRTESRSLRNCCHALVIKEEKNCSGSSIYTSWKRTVLALFKCFGQETSAIRLIIVGADCYVIFIYYISIINHNFNNNYCNFHSFPWRFSLPKVPQGLKLPIRNI